VVFRIDHLILQNQAEALSNPHLGISFEFNLRRSEIHNLDLTEIF
jgi:hypothetical protein